MAKTAEQKRAYHAAAMRRWRRENPEKELTARIRSAQRRLERLRENQAITQKISTPDQSKEG